MSLNVECNCPCPETVKVPVTGFDLGLNTAPIKEMIRDFANSAEMQAMFKAMIDEAVPASICKYDLCEFYYFRNPALKPGFELADGGIIENAAAKYPEAWGYLQTPEGQSLCRTEEEWHAMSTATWATLADGTTVGWEGIGGAPFYAPDFATGTLRLPDLRGMYAEAAGFDSLDVGGAHGDAIREISGQATGRFNIESANGAFFRYSSSLWQGGYGGAGLGLDISRIVPTANKNQPRAWGALACVYLGAPK